ncbi:MAG: hypothetical protein AAGD25_34355 [Cyanobacteria bacterium P01_F01_bin.150]
MKPNIQQSPIHMRWVIANGKASPTLPQPNLLRDIITMNDINDAMAQLLDRHFDTAFAAPDGIKKLRELILTLAMQGKLVPQNPNDQPASELLEEIEAEKQRLEKIQKTRKSKPLPELNASQIPYGLPNGWLWTRMEDLCVGITSGSTPPKRGVIKSDSQAA